jgi:hypothetical protein
MKLSNAGCLLILLMSGCQNDDAVTDNSEITIGFSGQDVATSMAKGSSGYFLCGTTTSTRNQQDMYLAKLDEGFRVQWSKSFGGAYNDVASRVIADGDGGCVLVGTVAVTPGNTQIVVLKTDRLGIITWYREFGTTARDEGRAIIRLENGGFVIGGTTDAGPTKDNDFFLANISSNGQTVWSITYGDVNDDRGQALVQTADGGFVLAGYRSFVEAPSTEWNVLLVKFDTNGNALWEKTFNNRPIDQAVALCATADGGLLIGAQTEIRGLGADVDNWLIKTDVSGNSQWTTVIGSTPEDRLQSVYPKTDGTFLIAGFTNPAGANIEAAITLVSTFGQVIWTSSFGSPRSDALFSIIEGHSDQIIGAGYTQRSGNSDIYIVLPDINGNVE